MKKSILFSLLSTLLLFVVQPLIVKADESPTHYIETNCVSFVADDCAEFTPYLLHNLPEMYQEIWSRDGFSYSSGDGSDTKGQHYDQLFNRYAEDYRYNHPDRWKGRSNSLQRQRKNLYKGGLQRQFYLPRSEVPSGGPTKERQRNRQC